MHAYWKMIAVKKRDAQKAALLSASDRDKIIADRMTIANDLLAEGKTEQGNAIFQLFRDVFYGEQKLEPWLDYAKFRLHRDEVDMPVPQQSQTPEQPTTPDE